MKDLLFVFCFVFFSFFVFLKWNYIFLLGPVFFFNGQPARWNHSVPPWGKPPPRLKRTRGGSEARWLAGDQAARGSEVQPGGHRVEVLRYGRGGWGTPGWTRSSEKLLFFHEFLRHRQVVFHTFGLYFEQTSFRAEDPQRFQRQIYRKYINADMSYCCRVLKRWPSSVWMEVTLSSECKAFIHFKRYRKVYLNINVYICKDIYRFNMWILSSKA